MSMNLNKGFEHGFQARVPGTKQNLPKGYSGKDLKGKQ